jgi:4-hydroxybenzoate polyprenyltransferase
MMDELKDLDKDRIAHPARPLPRGLISPEEVRSGLRIAIGLLLVVSVFIGLLWNPVAGVLLGLSVGYSLLMYREFFAPDLLGARPFSYAATHQIIIVPIYAFATATALPEAAFTQPVLWFAATGLGASFALEVCRKLDPDAHPALGTYLIVAGPGRTATAVLAAMGLATYAAYQIGVHTILWPVALLLLASLGLTIVRPASFKWTAGFAGLFVLAQIFAPTIVHFTGTLL